MLPGATTSEKEGPLPFRGVPVTRYPDTGPVAGVQRTVMVLSFTSVTSISDGDSISIETSFYHSSFSCFPPDYFSSLNSSFLSYVIIKLYHHIRTIPSSYWGTEVGRCTCFVCDVDGCAGGGAVSSACYSIHSDGVVSAWAQTLNSGSGLRARDDELFRRAVTTWGSTRC